jgi:outer membrane protein OmpA-like peptidoglycan-associated protein
MLILKFIPVINLKRGLKCNCCCFLNKGGLSYLICLSIQLLNAQSLVINPSFEKVSDKFPKDWTVTALTPDFYSKKLRNIDQDVPPKYGENYMGYGNNPGSCEILQGGLTTELKPGKLYAVKLMGCKGSFCMSGIHKLEVAFFKNKLPESYEENINLKPQHINLFHPELDTLKKKGVWQEFRGYYLAKGGEKYVALGHFSSRKRGNTNSTLNLYDNYVFDVPSIDGCSYFFVDSLLVEEYSPDRNRTIILPKLNFDHNKYTIKKESFYTLDVFASYLAFMPKVKIRVEGHTSNIGDSKKNLELSERRALAVKNYLISKGIQKDRIVTKGFGAEVPLSLDEEGDSKNRRVEIRFLD